MVVGCAVIVFGKKWPICVFLEKSDQFVYICVYEMFHLLEGLVYYVGSKFCPTWKFNYVSDSALKDCWIISTQQHFPTNTCLITLDIR